MSFFSTRSSLTWALSFSFSAGELVDVFDDVADLAFQDLHPVEFGGHADPPSLSWILKAALRVFRIFCSALSTSSVVSVAFGVPVDEAERQALFVLWDVSPGVMVDDVECFEVRDRHFLEGRPDLLIGDRLVHEERQVADDARELRERRDFEGPRLFAEEKVQVQLGGEDGPFDRIEIEKSAARTGPSWPTVSPLYATARAVPPRKTDGRRASKAIGA